MDMKAIVQPIIVDIGKQKTRRIKKLKRGESHVIGKVDAAIQQALSRATPGKEIVPVVIIYQKKDRRRRRGVSWFGPF
jgi:hypothetical protein